MKHSIDQMKMGYQKKEYYHNKNEKIHFSLRILNVKFSENDNTSLLYKIKEKFSIVFL